MTIDRIFLGIHSTEALGAAMAVMGIFWTPMALLQQTSAYVTTFIAQYFGADQKQMVGPSLWQSVYLSIGGGLLFLLLIFVSDDLFIWIGHSNKLQFLEIDYFNAICFSALPMALVAAYSGFYTGLGNTKTVMAINGVGLIANVIFDYLFIFGHGGFPAMGIKGAGYATALSGYASALFGFWIIYRNKQYEINYAIYSGWRWNKDLVKRYLRFGVPSGLQWSLEGLAFTLFMIIIGRFPNGEAALASSSIAITVMMLSVLPAMGVAQAVMVLVGQHLGEKKPEAAQRSTISGAQVSAIYMILAGLSFIVFPEFYLSWFKSDKNIPLWSEVQTITPYLLAYVAIFTAFDSLNLNLSFALKGAGDTRFVSLVALFVPWPLMVLPTFFTRDWSGAVYWAWGFATLYICTQAIIFLFRFQQGRWKKMSVIS